MMQAVKSQAVKLPVEEKLVSQFEQVKDRLPGEDWASEQRLKGIRRFGELGLPSRRVEAWKYTDLRALLKQAMTPSSSELNKVGDGDLYRALGGDLHGVSAHHLVFVDGVYDEGNSFIISDEAGFIDMTPLHEALEHPPEWLRSHFNRVNPQDDDPMLALNSAYMSDGAVIQILKGRQIKRPIHLIYLSSREQGEAISERNFIHVEEGAGVTILESYAHLRAPDCQRNSATEVLVDKGAKVSHIKFQHEGARAAHFGNWMVSVGAEAEYRAFQFTIGAQLSRSSINVRFDGEGAMADVSGVSLLWDEQHGDTTLNVTHAVPRCASRELFKMVLDDRARGVFQGKLVVRPGAQQSDAKQMARSLMLSDTAEFDAKPELEIYADDVACGHGATSGQIDEEMMFYMRQRGMSEEQARSLLILAFVAEALEEVQNEDIKLALLNSAKAWLGAERERGE